MSPYRIILKLIPVIVCLMLHKTYAVTGNDGDDTHSANDGDKTYTTVEREYETCIRNLINDFGDNIGKAAFRAFDFFKLPQGYNPKDFDIQSAVKDTSSSSTSTNQPEAEVSKHSDYWLEYYTLFHKSILPVLVRLPSQYCNNLFSYYYENKVKKDLKEYINVIRGQCFEIPIVMFNDISKEKVKEDLEKYIRQIKGRSEISDEEGSTFNDISIEKIIEDFENEVKEDFNNNKIRNLAQDAENKDKIEIENELLSIPSIMRRKRTRRMRKRTTNSYIREVYVNYKNKLARKVIKDLEKEVIEEYKKLPNDLYMIDIVESILQNHTSDKVQADLLNKEYTRCKSFLVDELKFPDGPPVEIVRHAFYALVNSDYFPSGYGKGYKEHIRSSFQIYRVLQRDSDECSDKHYEGVSEPESYEYVSGYYVRRKCVKKGEAFPKHYATESTPLMLTCKQFCEEKSKEWLIICV